MTRLSLALSLAFAALASPSPSLALDARDTIAVWKGASAQSKSELVKELLNRDGTGGSADIIKCLDATSSVPGHGDLRIGEIVKACEKQKGEPA